MFIRSIFGERYNAIFLKSRLPFPPPASRIFLLVSVCCQKNVSFVLTKWGTYIRKLAAHVSILFNYTRIDKTRRQRLDTKKIRNFNPIKISDILISFLYKSIFFGQVSICYKFPYVTVAKRIVFFDDIFPSKSSGLL